MSDDPYAPMFADGEYVVYRRVDASIGDEILTQDDRFEVDGEPVRVTSGFSVSTYPNGTVQILAWDGWVSAPTLGCIDLSVSTNLPSSDATE